MEKPNVASGYVTGKCLIAMPGMADPNFSHAVVYVCAHTPGGSMGLIINHAIDYLSFSDVLQQLGIQTTPPCEKIRLHSGGPVDASRGFILHTAEYRQPTTLMVDDSFSLTASTDILLSIAEGNGPRLSLMALGYAGWGAGQLDVELKGNSWLTVDADETLLFADRQDAKWELALRKLGIDPAMLSETVGHA